MSKIVSGESVTEAKTWVYPDVASKNSLVTKEYHEGVMAFGGEVPSVKDIRDLEKNAYDESYEKGHAEGLNAVKEKFDFVNNIVEQIGDLKIQVDKNVKTELVELAIVIAKEIILQEPKKDKNILLNIVESSIDVLPSLALRINVVLNPEDLKILEDLLSDEQKENWNFIEDENITRGGCKVFSENSSVDATVENKLAKVVAKFFDVDSDANLDQIKI